SAASSPQPTTTRAPTPTLSTAASLACPAVLPAQPGPPPAAPPSLYVSLAGSSLAALNLNSPGDIRWQDTVDPDGVLGAVQVANNVVYVSASYGNADGILAALNASDGLLRWCIALEPLISNPYSVKWSQLAVDGQTVYSAGGQAGALRAINASNGSERWHA